MRRLGAIACQPASPPVPPDPAAAGTVAAARSAAVNAFAIVLFRRWGPSRCVPGGDAGETRGRQIRRGPALRKGTARKRTEGNLRKDVGITWVL